MRTKFAVIYALRSQYARDASNRFNIVFCQMVPQTNLEVPLGESIALMER